MSLGAMKSSNNPNILKTSLRSAVKLSLFVVVSVILLLAVKALTDPLVAKAEKQTLLSTFDEVLPVDLYDNNPIQDTLLIEDSGSLKQLGSDEVVTLYRARKAGKPVGVILTAIAPNGYSGQIHLLIGVLADGRISGVRVLKHKETPGLGDKIEIAKNPWILEFDGRNLREDNDPRWAVKKDGGDFDQFTGATITPRAVVGAVKRTLKWINQQGETLYD